MGIAPYKTFTFDGESSADYGVYLTGEGVFNAPERSVEMVEIPGRNGAFALDKGKFENISVTYKVGMFDVDESTFAEKVSDFRNWLCSKVGYVRLSDDYNPDEYRMAVYASGLELEHDFLIAGEASITFDCKPQRWLTSGETATTINALGTLTNPTLFESEPLIAIKGYGVLEFNDYYIELKNVALGDVIINEGDTNKTTFTTKTFDTSMFSNGDSISSNIGFNVYYERKQNYRPTAISVGTYTNCTVQASVSEGITVMIPTTVTKNTSQSVTCSITYTVTVKNDNDGTTAQTTKTLSATLSYDGNGTWTISGIGSIAVTNTTSTLNYVWGRIEGESSKSALGNPTYIDCDTGECYMYDSNNNIVSLNRLVDLGSDLPRLAVGTTTFYFDLTITELKVTPRWWKV